MAFEKNPFLNNDQITKYPLEVLVDQNLRKDGIIQKFEKWPTAHLIHMLELLQSEINKRIKK